MCQPVRLPILLSARRRRGKAYTAGQGGIMKRKPGLLAAVATVCLAASSVADAAPTARQKLASVQYLVGTWSCAHTVGTFSGTYTTTYANALGNLWLRQTYDFPPRQFKENGQGEQAEFLMGYDEERQYWVRFGILSTGQYFPIRLTDTGNGGWAYKYISLSSTRKPETPGSDANFTKKSDTEYEVNGPTYEENGTRVTERHVCKKL
jgi:hypothetical protein